MFSRILPKRPDVNFVPSLHRDAPLKESFLHFIWQHRRFDPAGLTTTSGEAVSILEPGIYNADAGPDFLHARIRLGVVEWVGAVEIHIRSSDYRRHGHRLDPSYGPVILHVVWQEDEPVRHTDGTAIPALELRSRVDPDLVHRYRVLSESAVLLPCHRSIGRLSVERWRELVQGALVRRLDQQANRVLLLREACNGDWNETFYRLLARSFGLKVNADAFLRLSELLPLRLLLRHADRPDQLEALLFGMAGFLTGLPDDNYQLSLQQAFTHLQSRIGSTSMNRAEWKFLRMRPSGFPTMRIAQLAAVIPSLNGLLSELLRPGGIDQFRRILHSKPSEYWETHRRFGKVSERTDGIMGDQSADMIFINALVPFLAGWAKFTGDHRQVMVAMELMEGMAPEQNRAQVPWRQAGRVAIHAGESQALTFHLREYCRGRRCLQCVAGHVLLGKDGRPDDQGN